MEQLKMMMDMMLGYIMMRSMRMRMRIAIDATIEIVDFFSFFILLDTYCYFFYYPSSYYILGHFDLYGRFMLTYKLWLLMIILTFLDMDIKNNNSCDIGIFTIYCSLVLLTLNDYLYDRLLMWWCFIISLVLVKDNVDVIVIIF